MTVFFFFIFVSPEVILYLASLVGKTTLRKFNLNTGVGGVGRKISQAYIKFIYCSPYVNDCFGTKCLF